VAQLIPLDNSPRQIFDTNLNIDDSTIHLYFEINYNDVAGYWIMKISDSDSNILLDSIPLLPGKYPAGNILRAYAYLGIGSAWLVNADNSPLDHPDDKTLGTSFLLFWGDTPT